MKFCSRCELTKELEAFSKRTGSKDGYCAWCRACMRQYRADNKDHINARQKKYRDKNREHVRASDRTRSRRTTLAKYGLTVFDYAEMVEAQDGLCIICDTKPKDKLVVDHCHDTGEVRGLLCRQCNAGLGQLKDDVRILKAAIVYLS